MESHSEDSILWINCDYRDKKLNELNSVENISWKKEQQLITPDSKELYCYTHWIEYNHTDDFISKVCGSFLHF